MSFQKYKYRPELLEQINAQSVPLPYGQCTKEQAIKLNELGVTCVGITRYIDTYFHVLVNPNDVPDEERHHFSRTHVQDDFGYYREMLIGDTKTYISEAPLDYASNWVNALIDQYRYVYSNGRQTEIERREYEVFSDLQLEAMIIRASRTGEFPVHYDGQWCIQHKLSNGLLDTRKFPNRAEALAQVLIEILEKAPEAAPEPTVFVFNGDKANYNDPKYLARIEANRKEIEEMKRMRLPRRCTGCGNCKCNRVYGKSG